MSAFINIVTNIIFPIFVLISVGFIAQKKFQMDVRTFSKLNMYIFVPAIIFSNIYKTQVTWQLFLTILIYLLVFFVFMFALGMAIAHILNYPRGIRNAFTNSILFFNSGNYGVPVAEIAFQSNPLATTAQIFIMVIQTVLMNTVGVFQSSSGKQDNKQALKNALMMPAVYVLILVASIKTLGIVVPQFLMVPLENLARGFIPVALLTLGVQLADVKISTRVKDMLISSSIRLVLAPILGFMFVNFMGVEGLLAKVLILGVATPTAVNIAVIAREFDNEPEYASQIVFVSTLLSVITIPLLILLLEYM